MGYLYYTDYKKNIEDKNIQDIISSDDSIRLDMEGVAQEELISYLIQKYDTAAEFKDSNDYLPTAQYNANNVIRLTGSAYIGTTNYGIGDLCSSFGFVYKSLLVNNLGHAPLGNPTWWKSLGAENKLFYSIYPEPLFEIRKYYRTGDKVFWNNKKYTCKIDTAMVFPDDLINGTTYWGVGIAYLVAVDKIGATDQGTYYLSGDCRSAKMVMSMCEIVLYHIHKRIAPNNIPDIRVKAYDDVITWLKDCASGNVTPNLNLLQTVDNSIRIRYGSRQARNYNDY